MRERNGEAQHPVWALAVSGQTIKSPDFAPEGGVPLQLPVFEQQKLGLLRHAAIYLQTCLEVAQPQLPKEVPRVLECPQ